MTLPAGRSRTEIRCPSDQAGGLSGRLHSSAKDTSHLGFIGRGTTVIQESFLPGVYIVQGGDHPWYCFSNPCTRGQYILLNNFPRSDSYYKTLLSHEYIHVLRCLTERNIDTLSDGHLNDPRRKPYRTP